MNMQIKDVNKLESNLFLPIAGFFGDSASLFFSSVLSVLHIHIAFCCYIYLKSNCSLYCFLWFLIDAVLFVVRYESFKSWISYVFFYVNVGLSNSLRRKRNEEADIVELSTPHGQIITGVHIPKNMVMEITKQEAIIIPITSSQKQQGIYLLNMQQFEQIMKDNNIASNIIIAPSSNNSSASNTSESITIEMVQIATPDGNVITAIHIPKSQHDEIMKQQPLVIPITSSQLQDNPKMVDVNQTKPQEVKLDSNLNKIKKLAPPPPPKRKLKNKDEAPPTSPASTPQLNEEEEETFALPTSDEVYQLPSNSVKNGKQCIRNQSES